MKVLKSAIILLALTSGFGVVKAELANVQRQIFSLDADWRFHLGDINNAINIDYDDRDWQGVDVPHDYVVEGAFDPNAQLGVKSSPKESVEWYKLHGFLRVQPAWYRKAVSIPAAAKGRRLWVEFDGVFSNSRYWLNGREIGSQYSGYSSSRFDITDAANYGGKNILTVRVDPWYDGWWYEGGGIYRHVRLVMLDSVHISPCGVFVAPTVADPCDGIKADAMVAVTTDVNNESSTAVTATVLSEIIDASGKVVVSEQAVQPLSAGAKASVAHRLEMTKAILWSLENPYLYQLRSTISVSGKTVDQVTTNFGVRHIRFDADR
jgi:beta-galactosidase